MSERVIDLEEALSAVNTYVEEVVSGLESLIDSMENFGDEDDPEAVKVAIKEFISDAEYVLRKIK